jgi:hypothetical protein
MQSSSIDRKQGLQLQFTPWRKFKPELGSSFITCEIKEYEIRNEECFNAYAVYKIELQRGKLKWCEQHRFSDFDKLYQYLQAKFGGFDTSDLVLPDFPPKTFFAVANDEEFLKQRTIDLNEFTTYLLISCGKYDLLADQKILEFFGIDPNGNWTEQF